MGWEIAMRKKAKLRQPPLGLLLLICLSAANSGPATAQETANSIGAGPPMISEGETLSLERVVNIARALQPDILAARGSVKVGRSRVGQAGSAFLPQVDGSADYHRFSPTGSEAIPADDDKSYNQHTAGVTVKQLLYDFGQTETRVAIQQTAVATTEADLAAVVEQIVFNVKTAYFDLLRAARNLKVAVETVKQFESHLEQAKGFFETGLKPKYDVTKAMVDLSSAKLNLIRAENGGRLARISLNTAMGLPKAPFYELQDNLDFVPFTLPLEEALEKAETERPDLKALLLQKKGAKQAVELARKGYYPLFSGSANFAYGGESFPLDEGWDVGVGLSIPIFNGHRTRYEVDEAQANLSILAANETALRQSIYHEVRQSYLNLQEAEERVKVTQQAVMEAEENVEITVGRYKAGVGNPVEVTDADVALANARFNHIAALYDYKISQASIEKAIGGSLW